MDLLTEQSWAKTLRGDVRGAGDGERKFHALGVIDVDAERRVAGVAKIVSSWWERRTKAG